MRRGALECTPSPPKEVIADQLPSVPVWAEPSQLLLGQLHTRFTLMIRQKEAKIMRPADRPGGDLLSVRQHLVSAVLRREWRVLSRGANSVVRGELDNLCANQKEVPRRDL